MPNLFTRYFFQGTGYEILNVTASISYNSSTPLTVTCPAGKYLLDQRPDFGVYNSFIQVSGSVTTTTLPDGRVLPTGWSGNVSSTVPPTTSPAQIPAIFRCIYA